MVPCPLAEEHPAAWSSNTIIRKNESLKGGDKAVPPEYYGGQPSQGSA
jgi:hypothetical protein